MTNFIQIARQAGVRVALRDDATGAVPLDLPPRRMWPAGLICAAMFGVLAAVEWMAISSLGGRDVRDVFDLMFLLFQGFWVLGWSVGVVFMGAITLLLFFYNESARLQNGRLVYVPRLGPLKIITDYELVQVRNVRVENAGGADQCRVRFDDDRGSHALGDAMTHARAEALATAVRNAAGPGAISVPAGSTRGTPFLPAPAPTPRTAEPSTASTPLPRSSQSDLALIVVNLIPLGGVLFFGWDLASVIVLFWAESAVIAFYTSLKLAVVNRFTALLEVPFFIGHFGGFMSLHFLLIYELFVRGPGAASPGPPAGAALRAIFVPLWTSLAGMMISHGVSFYENFLQGGERLTATSKTLMTAPYNRIVVMQVALIFGGWIVLLLESPVAALALLVLLKTALDLSAHRAEHRQTPDFQPFPQRPPPGP